MQETQNSVRRGLLSIILPAYNEQDSIPLAAEKISALLQKAQIEHEILFVNDGSKDDTWNAILQAKASYPAVRGISFSKNFGKEAAIFAGLAHAKGACCVVLDCDLQHPPEKILDMYALWQSGAQVVQGVKASRGKESVFHTFAANTFYRIISRASHVDLSRTSDFKLLDRRAVDVLLALREKNTFFRALSSWIGFETAEVEFHVQPRAAGETKWGLKSLIRYGVSNITSFTTAPLQFVTLLGILVLLSSVILGIHSIWQKLNGSALEGFTTVIILLLFIGSILMICLGIIGFYIAKIYEEIKDRPRFIVERTSEDT